MSYSPFNRIVLLVVLVVCCLSSGMARGQETDTLSSPIFRIQPSSYLTQVAGGVGLVSVGAGWDYGKNDRWATDVLIGFVPKYDTDRAKITFTVRQGLTPWSLRLNQSFEYQPLRTGLYLSTTAGNQFWFENPDKYPGNYYTFSTKLRSYIYVGQSFSYTLPRHFGKFRLVDFYYDVHASDMMVISRIQNRTLAGFDYMGLALGLKFRMGGRFF